MLSTTLRLCKADLCIKQIPQPQLFCPRHWGFVPDGLRLAIVDAWSDEKALKSVLRRVCQAIAETERKASVL